jgi:anti-sigma factor RsiW
MMANDTPPQHAATWLLLPWLANGRLPAHERSSAEQHVAGCVACARELALQRRMCEALAEPDRVTWAPGPSFRKLLDRIDGHADTAQRTPAVAARPARVMSRVRYAWRPPGLAWAASVVLSIGLAGVAATAYRWSQPLYSTHTSTASSSPGVLHVAFDRTVPIGEVEDILHAAGAHVVTGPDASGVFGIAPLTAASGDAAAPATASAAMRTLETRLRAETRVRWVEPLTAP